jgi:hypothetical protein
MDRRHFLAALPAAFMAGSAMAAASKAGLKTKGVMLMNRIGPSSSELYIANADGSNERKLLQSSVFDYHAAFSADGKSIVFTSERNGDGQSDLFRCNLDGTASSRWSSVPPSTTLASFRRTARAWPSSRRARAIGPTSGCRI